MVRCWIIIIEFGASHRNRTVNATHRLGNHHAYKIIYVYAQSYHYFVGFLFGGVSHVSCICCRRKDIFFFFFLCLPSLLRMQTIEKKWMLHHSSPYINSVSLWVIAVFCMLGQSEWYDSSMQRLHYRLRMKAWKKKMISWPFDSLRIYILCTSFPLFMFHFYL